MENITILKLVAIFMISWLFVVSGYNKIVNFNTTVSGLQSKMIFNALPLILSQLAIIIAIILELASPILMTYGVILNDKRFIMAGVIGLIAFTILANVFYHPLNDKTQVMPFIKNTSIVGGLLYILANAI